MLRGEVRVVDFDPALAGEANERRPAVIVSNDAANATAMRFGRGVITVVPVTSNVERIYAFQVLLPAGESGLTVDSKAQPEQVRSVASSRVSQRIGRLPPELLFRVDEALRLHLAL